ncbi:MAG TPA: DUF2076 domain-containing protein [Hyphomicrobiaceae bacterium]|nr:DUF2076 domain-containing protein [Hyphomicrobiaceae bacterium]
MTPEERQLIAGLFDRMRGFTLNGKDAEAETLINEQVRSLRDAPYMLVQSVLVQEQALQAAESRIKELEEQVATLQSEAQPPATSGGSFLGGFLGGKSAAEPARGTSVPAIGSRATPPAYDSRPTAWGGQAAPQPPPQQAGGGGGFLQSALSTAAGVAGGMLVASTISNMLGGGHNAHAATSNTATSPQPQNAADTTDKQQEPVQEASYDEDDDDDDGGWFGGDDGGEMDI